MMVPGFGWGPADFSKALKKSSFAPGAVLLAPQQRRDLEIYYSFCRAVDDCADEFSPAQGRRFLIQWQRALASKAKAGSPLILRELQRICMEYKIPIRLLRELVLGALSDLRPKVRFKTSKELDRYCHQVAGVVGQACLPIFGLELERGRDYAEALGRAFQLINIVRDLREDAARGRIYFALSDLKRHGLTEKDLLRGQKLQTLLLDYAMRAKAGLAKADALAAKLPSAGIRPSRMMRKLYGALLETMLQDGLKVFEKRYRLGGLRKFGIVLAALL